MANADIPRQGRIDRPPGRRRSWRHQPSNSRSTLSRRFSRPDLGRGSRPANARMTTRPARSGLRRRQESHHRISVGRAEARAFAGAGCSARRRESRHHRDAWVSRIARGNTGDERDPHRDCRDRRSRGERTRRQPRSTGRERDRTRPAGIRVDGEVFRAREGAGANGFPSGMVRRPRHRNAGGCRGVAAKGGRLTTRGVHAVVVPNTSLLNPLGAEIARLTVKLQLPEVGRRYSVAPEACWPTGPTARICTAGRRRTSTRSSTTSTSPYSMNSKQVRCPIL